MNFTLYCIFFYNSYFYREIQTGALSPTDARGSFADAGKQWIFYKIMITNFIQIFFLLLIFQR